MIQRASLYLFIMGVLPVFFAFFNFGRTVVKHTDSILFHQNPSKGLPPGRLFVVSRNPARSV
jgi:hypothetical protein